MNPSPSRPTDAAHADVADERLAVVDGHGFLASLSLNPESGSWCLLAFVFT